MAESKLCVATGATSTDENSSTAGSNGRETATGTITIPVPTTGSYYPPPRRVRSPSPSWARLEGGIAIPIPSALKASDRQSSIPRLDSQRTSFTVPDSWRTPTPSSWGGSSYLLYDEASLAEGDDQSDKGTDGGSGRGGGGRSYAQKRRMLKHMSRTSLNTSKAKLKLHAFKGRWTKRLEDFRQYDLKSLLPLKAAVGASLAACLCFAPFIPKSLTYYGPVTVLGVGMSLDSNVGLTLQKGSNLMLGSALAAVCALVVSLVEPFTGSFRECYVVTCVFLGGFLPRMISLPAIVKTRWSQTLTFHITMFHGLILNQYIKMQYTTQFFLNCVCYAVGFIIVLFLTLFVKPDYAGDALLVLLVGDFHTAGVVLERIVEDYKCGHVLTKVQELLSGVVTEDHIHHDLQYIMKSTQEAENLVNAAKWEPSHGKFFSGYPWDLYPTLLAMLVHVMHDLIALDSALRAEIQAPLDIRVFFAEDMELVARECSMLFHKVGDALFEHQKIDYHTNVQRAKLATLCLRKKLTKHSASVINQDFQVSPPSGQLTRHPSRNSVQEAFDELPMLMSPVPTPPPSPPNVERVIEQDLETSQKLNINEDDWKARLFTRRRSISEHWEETQQQICSLSFIKFASILLELSGRVKIVVTMVDEISVKARFKDVT